MIKYIIFSIVSLNLFACSNECAVEIAGHQVRLADTIELNDSTYYLYTRTTGWQEKIIYFELYDSQPIFDECTEQPNIDSLYAIDYDDYSEEQYIHKIILQPEQAEKIKIIYTQNKDEGVSAYDVKFDR